MKEEQNINGSLNSWQVKKLGELCKQKEGLRRGPFGSAIKKDFFVPDGYKVYEQSNAIYDDVQRGRYFIDETKYKELINFNVLPGDLIVSCSGTLGRIAEIPLNAKAGVINQALLRIRLLDDVVSKKYFLYYFRSASFQKKIFDQSQGTAMSNLIGIKDFKEIELYIPSLKEQQQIVFKIEELFSELDKGIEELKTAQQQLKVYRQAVLKWAFEGKLTNEHVKDGELPEGWKNATVGDVCASVEYGSATKSKATGKIPVLRMGNIQNGIFDWEDLVYTDDDEEINKYLLKKNDVLFNRTNSAELVGKTAIYKGERPAIFAGYLIRINRIQEKIDASYLTYYLNSKQAKSYGNSVRSFGVNQSNINGTKLKTYPLPLPKLEEQQQIVQEIESRLSVCDKIEETITNSLKQAEALRQSILKKAFEGKLNN
jgi:type I restriction enzyme, S subunit